MYGEYPVADLFERRARLVIMAEIENLRRVSKRAEVDSSIALACLERAERLESELRNSAEKETV
jgi:hypothetical protein